MSDAIREAVAKMLPDHEIRFLWRQASGTRGGFHGPHTETAWMEEAVFFPFMREFVAGQIAGYEAELARRGSMGSCPSPANAQATEPSTEILEWLKPYLFEGEYVLQPDDAIATLNAFATYESAKGNSISDAQLGWHDPQWTCRHAHRCKEAQTCNGKICEPVSAAQEPSAERAKQDVSDLEFAIGLYASFIRYVRQRRNRYCS